MTDTTLQQDIALLMHETVKAMFPTAYVNGRVRNLLGSTICLTYASRPAAECSSGILENDPAFMAFHVYVDSRTGKCEIEFPSTHCCKLFRQDGLKFRKLSGDNEAQVINKLTKWFDKNREIIGKYNKPFTDY